MKNLLYLYCLIYSLGLTAQSYNDASEASELCFAMQGNSLINNEKAEVALNRILSVIGASKTFILQPCSGIDNALATSYKGLRYIIYDTEFMNDIANSNSAWSQLFILAHEVGHHINGHSIDLLIIGSDILKPKTAAAKRQQELESDEFAGFILAKLGASLPEASEAINLMTSNKDDSYSTHPNKTKRLAAVKKGYDKALIKEITVYQSKSIDQTAEEYFYRGLIKFNKKDYNGAIFDYTKAIELNSNNSSIYHNRGLAKINLGDIEGSIEDYTKAIELDPDYVSAYMNRGNVKSNLKDYYGSIADHTKAIEIDPNYAPAYMNRGNVKSNLKDYYGAIADYTKAIELEPNLAIAYYNRGNAKNFLKDFHGGIIDLTKAIELDPNDSDYYHNRGFLKYEINDAYGAIMDFTKTIELDPYHDSAYLNRGNAKFSLLRDKEGGCSDWKIAARLENIIALRNIRKYCN
jgi:tetratricopeptide (TPR) repeat protein